MKICYDSEAIERGFPSAELARAFAAQQSAEPADMTTLPPSELARLQRRWDKSVRQALAPITTRESFPQSVMSRSLSPLGAIRLDMPAFMIFTGIPDHTRVTLESDGITAFLSLLAPEEKITPAMMAPLLAQAQETLASQPPAMFNQAMLPILAQLEGIYQLQHLYIDRPKTVVLSREDSASSDSLGTLFLPAAYLDFPASDLDLIMIHEAFHLRTRAGDMLGHLNLGSSMLAQTFGVDPGAVLAMQQQWMEGTDEMQVDALMLDHYRRDRSHRLAYRALIARIDPDGREGARVQLIEKLNAMIDDGHWPPPPVRATPAFWQALLAMPAGPSASEEAQAKGMMKLMLDFPTLLAEPERSAYRDLWPLMARFAAARKQQIASHIASGQQGAAMIRTENQVRQIFEQMVQRWQPAQ